MLTRLKSLSRWAWFGVTLADLAWSRLSREAEDVAEDLLELGELSLESGRTEAAREYYSRAQAEARKGGHEAAATRAAIGLMHVWIRREEYQRAVDEVTPELDQVRRLMDKRLVANALRWFGIANERVGRLDVAATAHKESLAVATSSRDTEAQAWAARRLGALAYNEKDYKGAYGYYVQALALFQRRKEPSNVADAEHWLGTAAGQLGRIDEARQRVADSVQSYERAGQHDLATSQREYLAEIDDYISAQGSRDLDDQT